METVQINWDNKEHKLNVVLSGRLDAATAPDAEKKILSFLEGREKAACIVDVEKLGYISSAGLRVLLDLKKYCDDMKIVNVSLDIYDILTMTGFTKFIDVERRIRKMREPVPGDLISKGEDSILYRSTSDLAVRVFDKDLSLAEVQRRLKLSKAAVSHGIPTPIAFEIVTCGDAYGILYERTGGKTLADIWKERPDAMQDEIKILSELVHMMHSTVIEKTELPDFAGKTLEELKGNTEMNVDKKQALMQLISRLPAADDFAIGNLRLSNVMVNDGRFMFMDLTRCGRGNPILDLQAAISAMFADGHGAFWKKFFARYTLKMEEDKKKLLERLLDPAIRPWWY